MTKAQRTSPQVNSRCAAGSRPVAVGRTSTTFAGSSQRAGGERAIREGDSRSDASFVTADLSPVAAEAKALKDRYPGLLGGEPSFRSTPSQEQAVAALDAAQVRLRGGERPVDGQLSLDLRVT